MDLRKIVTLLMLVLLASPSLTIVVGQGALTVETDKAYYNPGEAVEIFGTAEANANVTILVNNALGTVFDFNVSSEADGDYSATFTLSADAVVGLYTVTAAEDDETAHAYFTVISISLQTHAENLLSIVENSKAQVESLISRLEAEDIEVPDSAKESIELGFEALEETLELMEDGDYSEAIEKAHQALQHFRNALKFLREVLPEEPSVGATALARRALSLKVAIEMAYRFVDGINATAQRLEEAGYAVADIEANLTEAKELLEGAQTKLESLEIQAAAHALAEARGTLGRTMGHLHSAAKKIKATRAEKFLEQVEKRIENLEEKINRLRERLTHGRAVLHALQATKMKLLRIRERLTMGQLDEAVDDLEDALEEIDDEVEELNGPGVSALFRAMNRLEAKIRVMNATAEYLAKKGADTSEIEEELRNAEALLNEIMTQLEEGDIDEAEELLEEVEESLEEIQEILDEIQEWAKKGKEWRPKYDEED